MLNKTIKKELDRIFKEKNTLTPQNVVDSARAEKSPLHKCFEWRDGIAGERYREWQARKLIMRVRVVENISERETVTIRAFASVPSNRGTVGYAPVEIVMLSAADMEAIQNEAMQIMDTLEKKLESLKSIAAYHIKMARAGLRSEMKTTAIRKAQT